MIIIIDIVIYPALSCQLFFLSDTNKPNYVTNSLLLCYNVSTRVISTSVVCDLPKVERRVRLPYRAFFVPDFILIYVLYLFHYLTIISPGDYDGKNKKKNINDWYRRNHQQP